VSRFMQWYFSTDFVSSREIHRVNDDPGDLIRDLETLPTGKFSCDQFRGHHGTAGGRSFMSEYDFCGREWLGHVKFTL
jgi:hypothetical protein